MSDVSSIEGPTETNSVGDLVSTQYGQLTIWNGRVVSVFPCNERYHSSSPHHNSWDVGRKQGIITHCGTCQKRLVDYFYECKKFYQGYIHLPPIIGLIFHRTCVDCCYDASKNEKIFHGDQVYKGGILPSGEYSNYAHQNYILPVLKENEDDFSDIPTLDDLEDDPQPPFTKKIQTFLDNFDADLADINETLIAGFFRSFGVIRDSVDFFVSIGEVLKENLGIDKEREQQIFENLPEDQNLLKSLKKGSPLNTFRKMFPTGREIQEYCCDAMGIKYEPNTPFKRVLEELGAAAPFGAVWMAISMLGQSAVESGLITQSAKPFYEIGLAVLAHKAVKLGKNYPTAVEVGEISKSLVKAEIDLAKIRAGNAGEIAKVEREVTKILDIREIKPREVGFKAIEDAKIPPTQANNTCGWKVGDPINNRTLLGDVPKWGTVRARHWKNKALDHKQGKVAGELEYEPTPENIKRMERGLAPQYESESGKIESIELHHEPPQRDGGLFDFEELTVEQHMEKDPNRSKFTYELKGD